MPADNLYLSTTTVPVEKTCGEISSLLIRAGARRIVMDYGDGGKVTGMNFILLVNNVPHPFSMPIRTEGIFNIFQKRRQGSFAKAKFENADREQAERVAWRQLLRWIQVQLAMVDAGMAEAREVFLPYLVDRGGKTVFQYFEETRFKELPPGETA